MVGPKGSGLGPRDSGPGTQVSSPLGREGAVWAGRLGLRENSGNRVSEGEGGKYVFWLKPFSELLGGQRGVFWERVL